MAETAQPASCTSTSTCRPRRGPQAEGGGYCGFSGNDCNHQFLEGEGSVRRSPFADDRPWRQTPQFVESPQGLLGGLSSRAILSIGGGGGGGGPLMMVLVSRGIRDTGDTGCRTGTSHFRTKASGMDERVWRGYQGDGHWRAGRGCVGDRHSGACLQCCKGQRPSTAQLIAAHEQIQAGQGRAVFQCRKGLSPTELDIIAPELQPGDCHREGNWG